MSGDLFSAVIIPVAWRIECSYYPRHVTYWMQLLSPSRDVLSAAWSSFSTPRCDQLLAVVFMRDNVMGESNSFKSRCEAAGSLLAVVMFGWAGRHYILTPDGSWMLLEFPYGVQGCSWLAGFRGIDANLISYIYHQLKSILSELYCRQNSWNMLLFI